MPTIAQNLCSGCGLCARVCTMGVLKLEDGAISVHPTRRCIGCWHCSAICPQKAIQEEGLELYPPVPAGELARVVSMRRSVRHYQLDPPDRAVIVGALERAAWAASAQNLQDYGWVVLWGRERVDELRTLLLDWADSQPDYEQMARLMRGRRDPVTCGCSCILLAYGRHQGNFSHTDAVIAATTAELLLVEQGVGTCWGGYLTTAVNACPAAGKYLGLPEGSAVYAVLLAGIPDNEPYCRPACRPVPKIYWK